MVAQAAPASVSRSFLTVEVGGERFALSAADVAEVIRCPAVTRVPLGPASLLGVANLRGAVVPIVSLHKLLGKEATFSANARVIVVDRGAPVGVAVDSVASLGSSRFGSEDDAIQARLIDLDELLAKDFGGFMRRTQSRSVSAPRVLHEQAAEPDKISLVCFAVAEQEFAMPLASVHEVVALPEFVTAVPRTDAVMLGVLPLRGKLVPLVSLRGLLGFSATGNRGRARVVVTQVGESLVGLAIDSMKEILRLAPDMIDPVPAIITRGDAEAQIRGICRLDGGQRLVSVLSSDHLFRDQNLLEQISSQTEKSNDMGTPDGLSHHDEEQFIVFQLGGEEYGLPIGAVDEVVRVPDTLTRLPKAPAFIEGVMNLRGRVVPIIDQRRRFRLDAQGEKRRERIVVVRIDDLQAGFVVDTVSEVLKISHAQLRPTPDLATDGNQVIDRIANIEIEGRMILLLDPRELLDRAEKDLLAAMSNGHPERSAP
ncbi:chemotaxis protein CheW [Microvirga guangxiensis]|uniref:Chemotaxis protein CheW n=1 Tax=Microvirga guangxiensis TaxID=549386 RepID=A0A1G5BMY6_9HYPH|nr:chemotaxis protein CheW [Microvirga guangxiensis]SCX91538.1 CheW protein [Microvirga guangxiensis]